MSRASVCCQAVSPCTAVRIISALSSLQILALKYVRHDEGPRGTRRQLVAAPNAAVPGGSLDDDVERRLAAISKRALPASTGAPAPAEGDASTSKVDEVVELAHELHELAMHRKQGSARMNASVKVSGVLPHTPLTYTFSGIKYRVTVKGNDGRPVQKPLLRGVTGYAMPGTLTALMGASGAGKTTLMDVLAFRKNTGVADGVRLLNRQQATPALFARYSGYCEQVRSFGAC